MVAIGDEVEVLVELAVGARVKRRADGRIDFVSPFPAPFAYGSIPGTRGGDGDPVDAVLLGMDASRGDRRRVTVRAVVRFQDAGAVDDKLVCSPEALTREDEARVIGFFMRYARYKRVLNGIRGQRGTTGLIGWISG